MQTYVSVHGVLVISIFGGEAYYNLTDPKSRKAAYDRASALQDTAPELVQQVLTILTNSAEAVHA